MFHNTEENLVANVVALRNELRRTETNLQSLGEDLSDVPGAVSNCSSHSAFPVVLTLEDLQQPDETPPLPGNPRLASTSKTMAERRVLSCSNGASRDSRSLSGSSSLARQVEMENTLLRRKLSTIQEENVALATENRQLTRELDLVQAELTNSKTKIRYLESTMGSKASSVPVLKEQLRDLEAEFEVHENALRDAEQRLEQSQQSSLFMERVVEKLKEELRRVKAELADRNRQGKRTEQQRNEALLNAEKLTGAFQEYKENVSEKLKKILEGEEKLKQSLVQCDRERDALQSQCSQLERDRDDLTQQLRRLQEGASRAQVMQNDLAAEKQDLLYLLEESKQKVSKLERELADKEAFQTERDSLQRENSDLRSLTTCQSQRLEQCQRDVEQTRAELASLESILAQLQPTEDAGGVTSSMIDSPAQSESSEGYLREHQAQCQDLRLQLSLKEAEVQRLQAQLTSGLTAPHLPQRDLLPGEGPYQQLLPVLRALQQEKGRQAAEVKRLQERLAKAQAQISSLQSCMDQRARHFQHIHDELLGKAAHATTLEKELKKKSARLAALERQLQEKTSAYSAAAVRNTDLEQDLLEKSNSLQRLENSLNKKQKDFRLRLEKTEKVHAQQNKELEDQIKLLQLAGEQKQAQLRELDKSLASVLQDREEAQRHTHSLQAALAQLQQEMEAKTKRNEEALRMLKEHTDDSSAQVKCLETALATCKEEISLLLQHMAESEEQFQKRLEMKSKEVEALQVELRARVLSLQDSTQHSQQLQHSLQQQQGMLQQSTARVAELEDSQTRLQTQLSILEQQLEKQKAAAAQELLSLEEKLRDACVQSEHKDQHAAQLNNTVTCRGATFKPVILIPHRECKGELEERNNELLDMDSALKERQWELQQRASQLSQLEVTVREHKTDMEQKIVRLEGALEKSQRDVEERDKRVQFLSGRLELMKTQLQEKENIEREAVSQGQQVRLGREQLQRSVQELQDTRRQVDRLTQDLDHSTQLNHDQEARINRLAEELGAAQARAAQAEARLQERVRTLQEEMEQLKQAHHRENPSNLLHKLTQGISRGFKHQYRCIHARLIGLQESQAHLLETTGSISDSLQSSREHLREQLRHIEAELDESKGSLASLQAELAVRDQVIQAANEALLIKDAEVARLEAKISSHERAVELQSVSLRSALPLAGSDAPGRDSTLHVRHSPSAHRDRHRSLNAADTVPDWIIADSLELPRNVAEHLKLSVAPLAGKEQSWGCGSEIDSVSSESSFNPLTYVVRDESTMDTSYPESQKPDLDTFSGMLQFVNQQIGRREEPPTQRGGSDPELKQKSPNVTSEDLYFRSLENRPSF
ncbi:coiled-coil domain-containing protein 18 [Amia ocellicauda]|uniref:coiled-coil domain-containing protein 18 n=1 Tax=Amia ocellicauda TaxID=2972642 RepID=UPI003464685F